MIMGKRCQETITDTLGHEAEVWYSAKVGHILHTQFKMTNLSKNAGLWTLKGNHGAYRAPTEGDHVTPRTH